MKNREVQFPQYGSDGDHSGSRRARRSFRFCVVACVLFTGILWFAEGFLRYEHAERLYARALTHEPESARVILLAAIRNDERNNEFPTPKYVEALAARAEDEDAEEFYAKAYKLAPNDSYLGIRYGCRLFRIGEHDAAVARLREAGSNPPKNALPMYLASAVMPWTSENEGLDEAIALVARTNNSGDRVIFPEPHWFRALPQGGSRHAQLRRQIIDECCAPLYAFLQRVIDVSNADIAVGNVQYWDAWLETLQIMGERLVASSTPGTIQTIAGIEVQIRCIEQRARIWEATGQFNQELIERLSGLKLSLKGLQDFERSRDENIRRDRQRHAAPLYLIARTALVIFILYLLAYGASKLGRASRTSWTLPQSLVARATLFGGVGSLLAIMFLLMATTSTEQGAAYMAMHYAWPLILVIMTTVGLAAPAQVLPSAADAAKQAATWRIDLPPDNVLRAARQARRRAYMAFLRRYFGMLAALSMGALSLWIVAFRIVTSLYPWQIQLLTTGLGQEEVQAVKQAIKLLTWLP